MADVWLTLKDALEEIQQKLVVSIAMAVHLLKRALSTSVQSFGQGNGVARDGSIPPRLWKNAILYVDLDAIETGEDGLLWIEQIKIDRNDLRHWLKEYQASSTSKPVSVHQPKDRPTASVEMAPAEAGAAKAAETTATPPGPKPGQRSSKCQAIDEAIAILDAHEFPRKHGRLRAVARRAKERTKLPHGLDWFEKTIRADVREWERKNPNE